MLPAAVQMVVPALSNVRLLIVKKEPLEMASVAPGEIMVRPVPLIEPPVQFIALPTVTVCAPPKVPFKLRMAGATTPVPSKLALPPEINIVLLVQSNCR